MSARVLRAERIAVLRANSLGDLVFVLPALEALRAAYPDAEITLLAKPWHAAFFADRPAPVDRVEVVPPYPGVTTEARDGAGDRPAVERFLEEMRGRRFDVALQMHGGGAYSNHLVSALGARLTAGYRAEGAPPLDRWVRYVYWQHEVVRALEAVSLVGAEPVTLAPRFTPTEADLLAGRAALASAGVAEPYAVLHPGASDGRRRWPPERYGEVARALAARGLTPVVVGVAAERELVERVRASSGDVAVGLGEAASLAALVGVLAAADVVVANDSGPLHLAMALGVPVVGLYWCGNVVNAGPLRTARARPLLSWQLHCTECGADCSVARCAHTESYVLGVPVEDVVAAVKDLLDAGDDERVTEGAA